MNYSVWNLEKMVIKSGYILGNGRKLCITVYAKDNFESVA